MRISSPGRLLALSLTLFACGSQPPPTSIGPETPAAQPTATSLPVASAPAPVSPPAPGTAAADPLEVTVVVSDGIRGIIAAPDRLEADKKLDGGRHAGQLLAFFGTAPDQRIAEIGSYQGYMAELLARSVAPNGKVYAQDPAALNKETRANWAARAKRPVVKNIVRVERPFDDPIPPDVKDLDAVIVGLFYHDMVWLKVDRAKMNAAIFRALKPGGAYIVYDHSARDRAGTDDAKTLHRIEEKILRREVEAAGFKLAATASFLRNPDDKRDWNASDDGPKELRGTSDRFVHKYLKP